MISIVIPALNEEKILAKTLAGFSTLTGIECELIVSVGQSSDRTIEVARAFTEKVAIYTGIKRQTIAAARNLGASLSSGEFLLFLDADVELRTPALFLATLLQRLEAEPELVAATVRLQVLPEQATLADRFFSTVFIDWPHYLNNNLFKTGSASGEFMFMRKSAFEQIGGFAETLVTCEDINLFERLAKIGQTRLFYDLTAYHSGRRFHELGWPKVLWLWLINLIYYKLFGHAKSLEWTVVR